jgi:peptide/nickel transport system permease protein
VAGIVLGTLAGIRAGKWSDTLLTVVSLLLYATPVFWLGLMLVLLFSVKLDWLPAFGYVTIGVEMAPLQHIRDIAAHLVLPATSLAAVYLAIYARLMRSSVIEVTHQDFIKTARAKGLKQGRIVARHILRNAILPVVTVAGMQAGALVGGAVVIETVFAWPGLGRLIYDAVLQRDYPVMLGIFLVTSVIVILLNLVTDVIYRLIDPRVSLRASS